VVLVGDRGMIKSKGKEALSAEGWKYITALTRAQIRTLLKSQVLQPDLFDTALHEVEHDGKRFILRRNEAIQTRARRRRDDKLQRLQEKLQSRNAFVANSSRANPEAGLAQLQGWLKRHRLNGFVQLSLEGREIQCRIDEAARAESALLDGCYVLESTVSAAHMDAPTVDARYRDLQKVERNFRTLKTAFLEVRPIFVRKAKRTRGHVFVAMLALKITRLFEHKLQARFGTTDQDANTLTLGDALTALSRITYLYYHIKGQVFARLPRLDALQQAIFEALGLNFPCRAARAM
jgi:transposase